MFLGTELELKNVETAVSKRLGIIPNTRGGGNSVEAQNSLFRNNDGLLGLLELPVYIYIYIYNQIYQLMS